MSELLLKNVTELRAGLGKGEFASQDLFNEAIAKANRYKDLNAFVTLCDPEDDKDDKKSLRDFVVPVGVKDIVLVKGVRATCGSRILENFVAPYDATVVTKLRKAGALIIGKTNLDEFAMGSSNETSYFGPVKNPWNTECVPGGSSGGSAAAVAARITPVALGTDTGGSIRQPASLSGIVGIKPTYGRVSRYGVIAYASSLDQVGCFATNVTDAAILTQIISGKDEKDSTSVDIPVPNFEAICNETKKDPSALKGLRVGIPKEYFIDGLNPEVREVIDQALKVLEKLGAKLVPISLPHTDYALAAYYIIAPAEASSNLARYDGIRYGHRAENATDLMDLYCRTRSEGFGDEVKRRIMIGTYVLSSGYYDAYYLKAQKVRTLIAQDFHNVFSNDCDVIACPTSPSTAFKIGEKSSDPLQMYLSDVFTIPVNLAGLPGMSVPCGFDSKELPVGLQLIGKAFDEATLFKTGLAFEMATEWVSKLPPIH